jgi:hypothetical protein
MISLGMDFVAGRKRVPIPATGKIALVTLRFIVHLFVPPHRGRFPLTLSL